MPGDPCFATRCGSDAVIFIFLSSLPLFPSLTSPPLSPALQDWKSEKTLYKAGLEALPLNAKLHNNYAFYLDTGVRRETQMPGTMSSASYTSSPLYPIWQAEADEKEYHLRRAIELYPPYLKARIGLGIVFAVTKRFQEATEVGSMPPCSPPHERTVLL